MLVGLILSVEGLNKKYWLPSKKREFFQHTDLRLRLQYRLFPELPICQHTLQILGLPASTVMWANSLKTYPFPLSLPLFLSLILISWIALINSLTSLYNTSCSKYFCPCFLLCIRRGSLGLLLLLEFQVLRVWTPSLSWQIVALLYQLVIPIHCFNSSVCALLLFYIPPHLDIVRFCQLTFLIENLIVVLICNL